jgi:IS30 family transposase
MDVQKNTKHFTQLTQEHRIEIYACKKQWMNNIQIAGIIWCHYTTIGRELANNSIDYGFGKTKYKPLEAQRKRDTRKEKANQGHIKLRKNHKLRSKIFQLLGDKSKIWGPDEILGRLELEWWEIVSTTTLYNYIHRYTDWRKYLKHKQEWYKHKRWKKTTTERIKGVEKIDKRCKKANERKRIWDKELDTIVSKDHKWGLLSISDRKSRYYIIKKVENLTSATILTVATHALKGMVVKTITSDNGSEFAKLARLCKRLKAKWYTCHSYCSREKGTNEKHNGFVRRFIPKGADISQRTDKEIQEIQDKLNHKPRKILWYRTPYEVEYDEKLSYTK